MTHRLHSESAKKRMSTVKNVKPKPSYEDMLDSPIIDLYIGPKRKKFSIHRGLLCAKSPFFADIFLNNDELSEEKENHYLPKISSEHFSIIMKWLYRGTLDAGFENEGNKPSCAAIEVYALAHQLGMTEMMDKVLTGLGRRYVEKRFTPNVFAIELAFELTEPVGPKDRDCGLRRWMARWYAIMLLFPGGVSSTAGNSISEDSLADLGLRFPSLYKSVVGLLKGAEGWKDVRTKFYDEKVCSFHEHEAGDRSCEDVGKFWGIFRSKETEAGWMSVSRGKV
ncbi:hypothetical protein BHYA_0242g00040 [Botrytis hyacinthi]|uniref:BTB domain-containing protein n=1 Tax=Botrytis hyacinthi TaxID=278943 RepID=A0A4Z1GDP2_9HELO|nr:hypothetical protein BHYA_0242g00040 [Botrytis hyacinthi]